MQWTYYNASFEYEIKHGQLASAWIGHRYFAYDLIRNIKPRNIVELGTHKGGSFFSFCQAVKDSGLNSSLIAIDTWKGDKHSGKYSKEVFEAVNNIKDEYYNTLNITLIRKTFNEALASFPDKSIDLLHIDGLHTYTAVKNDFENWLPKVKTSGIILIHDTYEKEGDFGVYKFWDELKQRYPTIDFFHEHGLGVVLLNDSIILENEYLFDIWTRYYSMLHQHILDMQEVKSKQEHINNLVSLSVDNRFNYQVKKLKEEIQIKNRIIDEYIKSINNQKLYLNNKINDLKGEISNYEEQLSTICNSKFFKLWQMYCKATIIFRSNEKHLESN